MTARLTAAALLALLLASCGTTRIPYSSGVPLSRDIFTARDNRFTGTVPEGWFSSVDDTLAPALSAWLTRNDLGAAITIREIFPDRAAAARSSGNGLKELLLADAGFIADAAVSPISEPVVFDLKGMHCCSAEFMSDQGPTRLVVFSWKDGFYECRAVKAAGTWSADDFRTLFTVQQTVLSSLK